MAGETLQGKALPDGLNRDHADLAPAHSFVRRIFPTALLAVLIGLSFTGLYGGMKNTDFTAAGDAGSLTANVPEVLRNGEFFEMRFAIAARRPIADATLVIDRSYLTDITVNTKMPEPRDEVMTQGAYRLSYGPLEAGDRIEVKLDAQINPELFGGTQGAVALADGDRPIARIPLTLRVLP